MPMVFLGNPAAIHKPDPEGGHVPLHPEEGQDHLITTAWLPPSYTLAEQVHNLAHNVEGQWNAHSTARRPLWVYCPESPELESALAEEFGCPVGLPEGVTL